jgi:hypothetical protein
MDHWNKITSIQHKLKSNVDIYGLAKKLKFNFVYKKFRAFKCQT